MLIRHTFIVTCLVAAIATGCQSSEPTDPGDQAAPDHQHGFDMHWATVNSFDELSGASDVVARGHIVAVSDGALRVFPWSFDGNRELTEAESGGVHDDTYVKLYTLQIDELVAAAPGVVDVAGKPVAVGGRIEVAELGGKMPCGCSPTPAESPHQRVGDEVMYFVRKLDRVPVGRHDATGLFNVAGGYQGRIPVVDGVIRPRLLNEDADNFLVRHEQRPVAEVVAEVRRFPLHAMSGPSPHP